MSPGIPPPRVPSLRPGGHDERALTRVIRRLSHCPSDGSAASDTLLLVVFLVNGKGMPGLAAGAVENGMPVVGRAGHPTNLFVGPERGGRSAAYRRIADHKIIRISELL